MLNRIILVALIVSVNTMHLNLWKKVDKPSNDPLKYNYLDFSRTLNGEWMEANRTDLEKDLNLDDSY